MYKSLFDIVLEILRWYIQLFTINTYFGVPFHLEVSKFNQAYEFSVMDSSKKKTDDLLQDSSLEFFIFASKMTIKRLTMLTFYILCFFCSTFTSPSGVNIVYEAKKYLIDCLFIC